MAKKLRHAGGGAEVTKRREAVADGFTGLRNSRTSQSLGLAGLQSTGA